MILSMHYQLFKCNDFLVNHNQGIPNMFRFTKKRVYTIINDMIGLPWVIGGLLK